jgi:hypothetical protein
MYNSVETTVLLAHPVDAPTSDRERSSVSRIAGVLLCVAALAAALTLVSNTPIPAPGLSSSTALVTPAVLGDRDRGENATASNAKAARMTIDPSAARARRPTSHVAAPLGWGFYPSNDIEDCSQYSNTRFNKAKDRCEKSNARVRKEANDSKLWAQQFYCQQSFKYFKLDVLGVRDGVAGDTKSPSKRALLGQAAEATSTVPEPAPKILLCPAGAMQFTDFVLYSKSTSKERAKIPIDLDKCTNPGGDPGNKVNPNENINLTLKSWTRNPKP